MISRVPCKLRRTLAMTPSPMTTTIKVCNMPTLHTFVFPAPRSTICGRRRQVGITLHCIVFHCPSHRNNSRHVPNCSNVRSSRPVSNSGLHNMTRIQHLNDALVLRMSGIMPSSWDLWIVILWCHCHLQRRQYCRRIRRGCAQFVRNVGARRAAVIRWRRRGRRCSQACI